jgi:multidrug resistance efflux pump
MVAITATSYATPPSQAWQGRARLDQARREADSAEANARQLRAQADQAEQEAAKGQDKVRAVSAQVAQSDSTYSSTLRQQIAATQSRRAQGTLAPVATVAANGFAFSSNPLSKGVFFLIY